MKAAACVLAGIAFAIGTSQPAAAEHSPQLREELVAMGAADQAAREKMRPFLASGSFGSDAFEAAAREVESVDAGNLKRLREIIARSGWPDAKVVGSDAGNSAFLVLQHSGPETQKELLPVFRAAVLAGKARQDQLAMLEDRILVRDGWKQRYGTQITAGSDGIPRVDAVEDPEDLDERRKAAGLPPMEEYLQRMEVQIGRKIDRSALAAQSEP